MEIKLSDYTGITADSREVKPGFLFVAVPGTKQNGMDFIPQAVKNGAAGIVVQAGKAETVGDCTVPVYESDIPRQTLSTLAARLYPGQPETVFAVTGTNGKSSVVWFAYQILEALGCKAAALGTLGIYGAETDLKSGLTSPDPVALHKVMGQLAQDGITHCALEASSHGLDQYRLDGLKLKAAALTNISRDHLDYHGTMQAYAHAKKRLFSDLLPENGVAVINADIAEYNDFRSAAELQRRTVISYGHKGTDIWISACEATEKGLHTKMRFFGQSVAAIIPVAGLFQISNIAAALGLCAADPVLKDKLSNDLPGILNRLTAPPGRMEAVMGHPSGAAIYVDYAHSPAALEAALKSLRALKPKRLICLFGCGGERDQDKRSEMGKISHNLADHIIVTDDNPRGEDPASIREQILSGCPAGLEIDGRRTAIQNLVSQLGPGDVALVAGKGHEREQIFADRTEYFNDIEEVQKAIKECEK